MQNEKNQSSNELRQYQQALSRWDNEGGAKYPGPKMNLHAVLETGKRLEQAGRDLYEAQRELQGIVDKQSRQLVAVETKLSHAQKLESVGRAVTILAHDFKNILGPIMGAVELLKRHLPPDDAETSSLLEMIDRSANDGRSMIEDVLTFIHKKELQLEKTDINSVIEQTDEILRQFAHDGIEIIFNLNPARYSVLADPSLLQRAVLNLIVNSCDAMPKGGTLTIETATACLKGSEGEGSDKAQPGKYVRLTIKDTGKGMPPEVLEKIHDAFFTTKPIGKGTGLGIPMIVDFVRLSNGRMTIESSPESGTSVNLFLPVYHEARGEVPLNTATESSSKETSVRMN